MIKTGTNNAELAKISAKIQTSAKKNSRWLSLFFSPLWLCLIITLVLRIWFVLHTQAFIDGDEAIVGIQAQHILHGERPVYYYGQPYMGSLEAYLIASLFAIFGIATWVMRMEPILLSLVLVWLTWKFAGALAELAGLAKPAKIWFQTIAGLFAALPPLYDGVIEMRAWGGHIEIYILMLAFLYAALRLTQRWSAEASLREIGVRWAGIGFLLGLVLWIYPLGISAVVAAALWIIGFFLLTLRRIQRDTEKKAQTSTHVQRLLLAVLSLPASLIGFAPAIVYGANNNWANILYLLSPGNNDSRGTTLQHLYPSRFSLLQATTILYSKCSAPRVIGGALAGTSYLQTFLFASIGALAILFIAGLLFLSFYRPTEQLQSLRCLVGLPALFGLLTAVLFCFSNISAAGLLAPCTRDEVGRYAAPLHLALPFFFATIAIAIHYFIQQRQIQQQKSNDNQESNAYNQASGNVFSPWTKGIVIFLYLCSLGINLFQYARIQPVAPFQSFACHYAPINDDAIIAYMHDQHITDAWATMWIGNTIVFRTQDQIHVADPRIITVAAANRLPYNTTVVSHANNPSILAFDTHGDANPDLLKALNADNITYKLARFPGSNGVDVMVITPINHTVSPFEGNSLGSWAYGC